jgi:hypothetical protein
VLAEYLQMIVYKKISRCVVIYILFLLCRGTGDSRAHELLYRVLYNNTVEINNNQNNMDDKTLFAKIKVLIEKADTERLAQNWKEANELLKQALAELGYRYMRENLRDDSGYRLVAADIQEFVEGKLDSAVRERRNVLVERLKLLERKIK